MDESSWKILVRETLKIDGKTNPSICPLYMQMKKGQKIFYYGALISSLLALIDELYHMDIPKTCQLIITLAKLVYLLETILVGE